MNSKDLHKLQNLLTKVQVELERKENDMNEMILYLDGLSERTKNALIKKDLTQVYQVINAGEDQIRRMGGIGNAGIREIRTCFENIGLHLPLWGK